MDALHGKSIASARGWDVAVLIDSVPPSARTLPSPTLLLEFAKWGQKDYRWLELIQLNEAFWRGQWQRATILFHTSLFPSSRPIDSTNLALNRPVAASSSPALAPGANDGDIAGKTAAWMPEPPEAVQWWQVDLGESRQIVQVALYSPPPNPEAWFPAFHLEVSSTGAFAGEQARVPLETAWNATRAYSDHGLQRLSGFEDHCLYTFPPVTGRYVRVVSDAGQDYAQLQEFQVFGLVP